MGRSPRPRGNQRGDYHRQAGGRREPRDDEQLRWYGDGKMRMRGGAVERSSMRTKGRQMLNRSFCLQ